MNPTVDLILNTVADPIFVKDRAHRWVHLNDAYCAFMGYPRERLLGRSDHDFFPPAEAEIFWQKDELVFATGEANENEESFTDSSGRTHVIVTKKTLLTDQTGEQYIVGVIRDITTQKLVADELRDACTRAEAASQAKTQFLSLISHELRTPLTVILAYGALLAESLIGDPMSENRAGRETVGGSTTATVVSPGSGSSSLAGRAPSRPRPSDLSISAIGRRIKQSAQHLNNLIETLIDFASIESGRFRVEPVTFNLVEECATIISFAETHASGARVRFTLHGLERPLWVRSDPRRLRQILFNLLGNAFKFTFEGTIDLILRPVGDSLEIVVRDSGIGIPREEWSRVFEPFHQVSSGAKRRFSGVGLGLSITRSIVEELGGSIGIESAPNRGSTFTVILPGIICPPPSQAHPVA